MVNPRLKKQNKAVDKKFLFFVLLLTALGLIAVADASAPQALNLFHDKFYFVKQQFLWGVFGVFLLVIFSKIHYSIWNKIALPLFIASLILLVLVLIPGIGTRVLGARRWIFLGPVSIQPSEIIKLTLAIYLARLAAGGKAVIAYFIPVTLAAGLIMLQPDLGTTLVVVAIGMSQIFVSGINLLYFAGGGVTGLILSALVIIASPYRRDRLLTFLKASSDPLGRDYHIRQILLALGSGGLFGVGLGGSRQKYLFLPEASTDSIFAIIAEEVGFIGALVLIFLFVALILKGLAIAKNAPDKFAQILGVGIMAWIGGQIFLNIGSMVALVPLTGLPLPFFSYGGSALSMLLASCGILLNISKYSNGKS